MLMQGPCLLLQACDDKLARKVELQRELKHLSKLHEICGSMCVSMRWPNMHVSTMYDIWQINCNLSMLLSYYINRKRLQLVKSFMFVVFITS